MRESDRLSRLLSEFLDFARVRVARTEQVDLASVARGAARLAAAHPDRRRARARQRASFPTATRCDRRRRGSAAPRDLQPRAQRRAGVARRAARCASRSRAAPPSRCPPGCRSKAMPCRSASPTTGPGIPPEIRDRMFDPFFTTKPNGSGLGLAVVHRAIEAHRGLVFVDSSTRRHALHRRAPSRTGCDAPAGRPRAGTTRRVARQEPHRAMEHLVPEVASPSRASSSSTTRRAFSTRSTSCCATKASRRTSRTAARRASTASAR